ncbi:MAG TPA: MxaK protein [Rhizobacter sp.]|nr:MxaK protein [Rhizobacter sp.]
MGLATRRRTRVVLGLLALLLAVAAIDAARTWRQQRWNEAIETGTPRNGMGVAPPEMQFAQAYAQAASGATDEALNRYRALQGDSALGQAARYNSANLLMRQAREVRAGAQPGQALPLIELAKETYREVLRNDPGFWDARYNLERAQRLLPDPDEAEAAPPGSPRGAERAATTMRGYSPGLP